MAMFHHPDNYLGDDVGDYVAVSHAGHGVNSYAITYHLVYRELALFAQVGWGGIYMDVRKTTAAVAELFEGCGAMADLAEARPFDPTSPWRMACVYSDTHNIAAAGWYKRTEGNIDQILDTASPHQLTDDHPLRSAERCFRAGPGGTGPGSG